MWNRFSNTDPDYSNGYIVKRTYHRYHAWFRIKICHAISGVGSMEVNATAANFRWLSLTSVSATHLTAMWRGFYNRKNQVSWPISLIKVVHNFMKVYLSQLRLTSYLKFNTVFLSKLCYHCRNSWLCDKILFIHTGAQHGLSVTLNIEQYEHTMDSSYDAGVKVD